MVEYRLRLADLDRHLVEVECRVLQPGPSERLCMPSWIPGSYLLREFARHVVAVEAASGAGPVAIEQVDKGTWTFSGARDELKVTLLVFALDESVRGAFVDRRRAYFNGPCVFPWVCGREHEPVALVLESSDHARANYWRVATAMQPDDIDAAGFGAYSAANYDELIDHPFEIGTFASAEFIAADVAHRLVIAGRFDSDIERIAADLHQLCETQIEFFGRPPPFDSYCFLALATSQGQGGLEHRASASLMFPRDNLPKFGEPGIPGAYQRFLALASHEYFHAWHVKQTKPAAFVPYRLDERNYTRQLWIFEGITSYYQELFLLRSALVGVPAFLQRLAETLTRVYRTPGRARQSLAESSFEAWDMLYKPTANSANAGVSYYTKGALVALALDLTLRRQSQSGMSLDMLVLELWERYGKAGVGVPEGGFEALACEIGGAGLADFFDLAVRGTDDLALAPLLADFAVVLEMRAASGPSDRGGRSTEPPDELSLGAGWREVPRGLELTAVFNDGAAERAGLNPGDLVIALDRLAVDAKSLRSALRRRAPGDRVAISAFRDGELIERELELASASLDTCRLSLAENASDGALELRRRWLGG